MKRALIFPSLSVALSLALAGIAAADNKPKGPKEDGTMPALTKIAGEGMMNSRAYQYLTELSDDIGSRVTGSPEERKSEDWAVAKMKEMGLENVHTEKYTIWKGWTRGSADTKASPAKDRNGFENVILLAPIEVIRRRNRKSLHAGKGCSRRDVKDCDDGL